MNYSLIGDFYAESNFMINFLLFLKLYDKIIRAKQKGEDDEGASCSNSEKHSSLENGK